MKKTVDHQVNIAASAEKFCLENPDFIYSKEDRAWYKYNGKFYDNANAQFDTITENLWEIDEMKFNVHLVTLRSICQKKCSISTSMNHQAELLLNTPVGVVDFHSFLEEETSRAGQVNILPHDMFKANRITMTTDASYVPNAKEPKRFIEFVYELCNRDTEMVEYLFTLMAYCLTGKNTYHYVYMLFGLGRNGKSVFLAFMEILMGTYFCKIPAEVFSTRTPDDKSLRKVYANRFKRLVVLDELPEKYRMNIALVKRITGGDSLDTPNRFAINESFHPDFKMVINTNFLPNVGSTQNVGIWDRLKVIFTRPPIKPEDRIDDFHLILAEEKDEVLTYILNNYLKKAFAGGLKKVPKRMALALEYKRFQENPIEYFVDKVITVANQPLAKTLWIKSGALIGEYTQFHLNVMRFFSRTLTLKDTDESNKLLVVRPSDKSISLTLSKFGGFKGEYAGREYWKNLILYPERIWSENGEKVAPEWLEEMKKSAISSYERLFTVKRQADELLTPMVQTKAIMDMPGNPEDHFEGNEPIEEVNFDFRPWIYLLMNNNRS